MFFRVASSHVQTIRGNFSRKYKNKSLACPGCCDSDQPATISSELNSNEQSHPRDTQAHVLQCDSYSDIRSSIDFDPTNDEHLADYFTKVVQRRIENGDD